MAPLTVPNLIEPPLTVPLMPVVSAGLERVIVPLSFELDSLQLRVNVPLKAPLYRPDHFPASVLGLDVDAGVLVAA